MTDNAYASAFLKEREAMRKIVDRVADLHYDEVEQLIAVEDFLKKASRELLTAITRSHVYEAIRVERRARTHALEVEAQRIRQSSPDARPKTKAAAGDDLVAVEVGRTHTDTRNPRERRLRERCGCDVCERSLSVYYKEKFRWEDERAKYLLGLLENVRAHVDMEWTEKLLDASFALPDGTRVLWGEATVEQHRARIEMLTKNVAGIAETAARHVAAVERIENEHATCLREALSRTSAS